MARVATDPAGGEHGYDYWAATVETPATPDILYYSFVAHDGAARATCRTMPSLDGGTGSIDREPTTGLEWQLTVYDPAFTTPAWTRGATVYQVFPDRFANGDPSNDPSPTATPDPSGADRFRHGDVYGNPILRQGLGPAPRGLLPGVPGRRPATRGRWAATSSAATWPASPRISTTWRRGASPRCT